MAGRASARSVGRTCDPVNAAAIRDWTTAYWDALHPYAAAGAYSNFLMDEGEDRVRASYGTNYERLAQVKAGYDPGNLFHVNQNIKPAPAARARIAGRSSVRARRPRTS